jgi:hypothetical protein
MFVGGSIRLLSLLRLARGWLMLLLLLLIMMRALLFLWMALVVMSIAWLSGWVMMVLCHVMVAQWLVIGVHVSMRRMGRTAFI